ncbi:MAG: NAD(P)H-binding protein [Acidobacteria bacterium]|nr:NAD(P)H-binding protein [Acidobacteriota bacterium]
MSQAKKQGCVFISGGTGYMGRTLIRTLIERGHEVRALARPKSEKKLPPGCALVPGNALDGASFADKVRPADTLVHLVGVSHPAPWKEKEFRAIDLASVCASLAAAESAGIRHFVYVSVAQPAPVLKAYVQVRGECEALIRASGLNTSILRPWYVLGPGHRWPYALMPFYWLLERLPATRDTARRLGLVTLDQMRDVLVWAIENPAQGVRILTVNEIRRISRCLMA